MSEEQAFQQAMQENPQDLTSRLVFADWLEERGDLRGELLRLTHILTQAIDVPDRPRLEARMQTLVAQGVSAVGPFLINSIGMRLAWIPPGTFLMGSPLDEKDRGEDETPHRVILTKGFYLGVHPVVREQWQVVMRYDHPTKFKGEILPVENVFWDDCVLFCKKLSKREGRTYRLPTEAEWEYACRAGSSTAYHFGNDPGLLHDYGWYSKNARRQPMPIGQKKPNAWGLHDMYGNVFEWCQDRHGDYPSGEVTDPQGPATGKLRVLRGGSWRTIMLPELRSASRKRFPAKSLSGDIGLRICLCP